MTKKEYFIEHKGNKQGAFTLEELKAIDIYDTALIWKAGWENWKKATEVEELTDFVIITPPPTKQEQIKIEKQENTNNFVNSLKHYFPKFLIGWVVLTLIWNFISFSIDKNGGSTLYPIYLTREEQLNPSLIFWNILPFNAMIIGVITLIAWFIYSYWNKGVKQVANTNYNTNEATNKTPQAKKIHYKPKESFRIWDYPEIIEEIETIKKVKDKNASEILIGYCKNKTIKKEFLRLDIAKKIVSNKFSIKRIENLFEVNKDNQQFVMDFENYIIKELSND